MKEFCLLGMLKPGSMVHRILIVFSMQVSYYVRKICAVLKGHLDAMVRDNRTPLSNFHVCGRSFKGILKIFENRAVLSNYIINGFSSVWPWAHSKRGIL